MVKFWASQTDTTVAVIFRQAGKTLTVHTHPIVKPEDYRDAIIAAYDHFHRDHPAINLVDGVQVIFDKVD
jgi:hypothetical protein